MSQTRCDILVYTLKKCGISRHVWFSYFCRAIYTLLHRGSSERSSYSEKLSYYPSLYNGVQFIFKSKSCCIGSRFSSMKFRFTGEIIFKNKTFLWNIKVYLNILCIDGEKARPIAPEGSWLAAVLNTNNFYQYASVRSGLVAFCILR